MGCAVQSCIQHAAQRCKCVQGNGTQSRRSLHLPTPPAPPPRRQLFRYHHEGMLRGFPLPPVPEWKGADSPDREEAEEEGGGAEGQHMHHEDVIGEAVRAWIAG